MMKISQGKTPGLIFFAKYVRQRSKKGQKKINGLWARR